MALSDWGSIAGIVGAAGTLMGLGFVGYQLRVGNHERQSQVQALRMQVQTLRTQATMLFQERFKESQKARRRVFREFPLHTSLLVAMQQIDPGGIPDGKVQTWDEIEELSDEDVALAEEVINAFNDVAQYVVDGLELRSALQQYHLPIMRVGALLNPYLTQKNAEGDGTRKLRVGRRIPILYNASLAYHRCNQKHRGREVGLLRTDPDDGRQLNLVFFDGDRGGTQQFECFADSPHESLRLPDDDLATVIAAAEEKLRQ
jgi:hypothetical protein